MAIHCYMLCITIFIHNFIYGNFTACFCRISAVVKINSFPDEWRDEHQSCCFRCLGVLVSDLAEGILKRVYSSMTVRSPPNDVTLFGVSTTVHQHRQHQIAVPRKLQKPQLLRPFLRKSVFTADAGYTEYRPKTGTTSQPNPSLKASWTSTAVRMNLKVE